MRQPTENRSGSVRCAIYTRKSSEEGLEQSFNSLRAQREACEAYIKSQTHEGWRLVRTHFDDGGFSGGNMDRPALVALINDIEQGKIDIVVVYKVDRLSRSLADFVRLVDLFDRHKVSFVSVTQQFNTSTSMGRLTLNVLLSFAQFEREVTGERIRDKIAASRKKGLWMGGRIPLGYDVVDKALVVNQKEAMTVQQIFDRYLALKCVRLLKEELDAEGIVSKRRTCRGRLTGGNRFSRGALYTLLKNPVYIGKVSHRGQHYPGQHRGIVEPERWEQVQQLLLENRQTQKLRAFARDPGLLAGLLFDDQGNPMSPTHTNKNGRRYRYYISQALLQFRQQEAGSVVRLAATTIEALVSQQLKQALGNGPELLDLFSSAKLSATHQQSLVANARKLAAGWDDLTPNEQVDRLKQLVSKVTIGQCEIRIRYSRSGLAELLLPGQQINPEQTETDERLVCVPVNLKRSGVETKFIVPNGTNADANQGSARAIQKALAKALEWNQALLNGIAPSMTSLARREKVTQRYVAHLIKLAFLAPGIIDAINKGEIPPDLTLGQLKKDIPLDWTAQARKFGFPASCAGR